MKLVAFRIQNFKSIIDSTWCDLAKDGVTCLIGQNESGKSSVLEALDSFGSMRIESDYLRSDGPLPSVSCKFEVDETKAREMLSFIENKKHIDRIVNVIRNQNWNITKTVMATDAGALEFEDCLFDDAIENEVAAINEEEKIKFDAASNRVISLDAQQAIAQVVAPIEEKESEDEEEEDEEEPEDEDEEEGEEEEEEEQDVKPVQVPRPIQVLKPIIPQPVQAPIQQFSPPVDPSKFLDAFYQVEPLFVMFNDESNLLPNEMGVDDISSSKTIDGKQAVLNLLKVAGIDIARLNSGNSSTVKKYMNTVNRSITTKFQDFWTQQIGKGSKISVEIELKNRDASYGAAAGTPYLEFWVKDDEHILHPKQRSKGVRWFLSFYLSLKADSMENKLSKSIFLIDEPGANLHARAQEDVLRVFEDIRQTNQVMYSTHSQHLIEFKNLHRLLAIQRRDDSDESSETIIIPAYHLGSASTNTLAPILEHMGIDLSNQNVIAKANNIILEEISAYYYLLAFEILTAGPGYNYLPATGVTNIEQLALLLTGWGIKFGVVFDDDSAGRKAFNSIKKNLYLDNDIEARKNIYRIKDSDGIEDLFSQNDFYKVLLKYDSFAASTKKNSDLAKELRISKPMVALDFYLSVKMVP